MTKAILIFNHRSGKYKPQLLQKITTKLETNGINLKAVDINDYPTAVDLVNTINPEDFPMVIVAGGDGTISSVCNAILKRDDSDKFSVAIIPVGTANVLAIELGITTVAKALNNIIALNVEKINVGEITSENLRDKRYFILMASAGLDSWAVVKLNEDLKKKLGKLAYIVAFMQIFKQRMKLPCYTIINNKKHKNLFTCVCNSRYYGGRFKISKKYMDEGFFNVVIANRLHITSLLFHIIGVLFNKNYNSKHVRTIAADHIRLESKIDNYPLQIDGDYFCDLPVDISLSKKTLNLVKRKK